MDCSSLLSAGSNVSFIITPAGKYAGSISQKAALSEGYLLAYQRFG
jgi:hypothetical protein